MPRYYKGEVLSFQNGWGFIAACGDTFFVHHRNILMDGYRYLNSGDKVQFILIPSKGDRMQAGEVTVIG